MKKEQKTAASDDRRAERRPRPRNKQSTKGKRKQSMVTASEAKKKTEKEIMGKTASDEQVM